MTYKLGSRQHWLLVEALRRFECFAVRRDNRKWNLKDLQRAWTGLGTRTDYKPVVDAGLMQTAPCTTPPARRCDGWWSLTEKGAKIILEWHNAGFTCGDGVEVQGHPPYTNAAA